jgi:hypothetical protein
MKPWLRLTLTLIGLALVCLFLGLSQPAGLNHPVAGSKPWLASWTEPAPGPPTASIYPSTKFDPVRARPLPCLVRDGLWTTSELGPPGLPTPGPSEPNGPWRVPDQSWQLKARHPAAFLHEIPAPSHRILKS